MAKTNELAFLAHVHAWSFHIDLQSWSVLIQNFVFYEQGFITINKFQGESN